MSVPASRVSRVVMTGPLARFAEAYVLELRRRGYTPLTSVNQLRQVGRLSSWLATQGLGVAELNGGRVEEFLAVQRAVGRHRSQWSRPGLLCLMEVLAGLGVIGAEPPPRTVSPSDELLESFAHYLRTERALAAGTVGLYVDHARRFLAGLGAEGWTAVTSGDVTRAVLEQSCAVSVSTAQNFVAALRAFLRFRPARWVR